MAELVLSLYFAESRAKAGGTSCTRNKARLSIIDAGSNGDVTFSTFQNSGLIFRLASIIEVIRSLYRTEVSVT